MIEVTFLGEVQITELFSQLLREVKPNCNHSYNQTLFNYLILPLSPVFVHNPHLDVMKDDVLYHFALGTATHNLPAMFGDVKVKILITFICLKKMTSIIVFIVLKCVFFVCYLSVCVCWRQSMENEIIH